MFSLFVWNSSGRPHYYLSYPFISAIRLRKRRISSSFPLEFYVTPSILFSITAMSDSSNLKLRHQVFLFIFYESAYCSCKIAAILNSNRLTGNRLDGELNVNKTCDWLRHAVNMSSLAAERWEERPQAISRSTNTQTVYLSMVLVRNKLIIFNMMNFVILNNYFNQKIFNMT